MNSLQVSLLSRLHNYHPLVSREKLFFTCPAATGRTEIAMGDASSQYPLVPMSTRRSKACETPSSHIRLVTHATIEVALFGFFFFSERQRLLYPKPSNMDVYFCMILVVYLRHGIFHPMVAVVFIFSPNQFFGRGLELSKLRNNLRKKVVHRYFSGAANLLRSSIKKTRFHRKMHFSYKHTPFKGM